MQCHPTPRAWSPALTELAAALLSMEWPVWQTPSASLVPGTAATTTSNVQRALNPERVIWFGDASDNAFGGEIEIASLMLFDRLMTGAEDTAIYNAELARLTPAGITF